MPPAISRSAHHRATSASLCRNKGGDFQSQPAPVCLPSKERKMHFLNHGKAPDYGGLCGAGWHWEQWESPRPMGTPEKAAWGWGQRGVLASHSSQAHPWPPIAPSHSMPGGRGGSAGACVAGWGRCPRVCPMPRLPPPQMCRRSQEPSRACWENASAGLFCIPN